ncbi:uncharacterized protein LOC128303019 [Anopheles moucheti]|uniref:uncharacterized protein LOC128303019 n=1 Tax=Anopheles moucheti TaxID=186751 RepID=UPI0022F00FA9|nr:uncharacterized protein LOC128303019 [Anopheles moucheti]
MNPRRLTSLWLLAGVLVVLATTVSCETDSETGGFFAHLWDSIFGPKQSPTSNSTSVKNETDSAFSYNVTTTSAASSTTPVSTTVSVESGKNLTTTTTSSSTGSSSSEATTEGASLKNKEESNGTVSTSTAKLPSSDTTTVGISATTATESNGVTTAGTSTVTAGSNATTDATFVGVISEAIKRVIRVNADASSVDTYINLEPTQTIAVLSQLAESSTIGLLQSVPDDDPPQIKFRALQYALFSSCFVEIFGGVFFLITAIYIDRDRARVEAVVLELTLRIED